MEGTQTISAQDAQVIQFYHSQLWQDTLHDSEATRIRNDLRAAYRATVLVNDKIRARFRNKGRVKSTLASIRFGGYL